MKYEITILHAIKYSKILKNWICEVLAVSESISSDDLILRLETPDQLKEFGHRIFGNNDPAKLFQYLYEYLKERSQDTIIVPKSTELISSDKGLIMSPAFTEMAARLLNCREDEDDVFKEFFDIRKMRNLALNSGIMKESEELREYRLIARIFDHEDEIYTIRPDLENNIWRLLNEITNRAAKKEIRKKNGWERKDNVIKKLIVSIKPTENQESVTTTQEARGQYLDTLAMVYLKSEINAIKDTYTYNSQTSVETFLPIGGDKLDLKIAPTYYFHKNHAYRLALEKWLHFSLNEENDFFKVYFDHDNKIDPKVVQCFMLSGIDFPDPFGFANNEKQKEEVTETKSQKKRRFNTVIPSASEVAKRLKKELETSLNEEIEIDSFC